MAKQEDSDVGLASFSIDPEAELPTTNSASAVSGQQEVDFYSWTGEQAKLAAHRQNLGYLGKFFGANASAPSNIAGFVVGLSMLMVFATFALSGDQSMIDARNHLFSLIAGAVGFLFGATNKK